MILPIVAYGHSTLRKKCIEINKDHSDLNNLIEDMWQTMYNAEGVGLAAPQIGLSIRLFIIDAHPLIDSDETLLNEDFKKHVFINPKIIDKSENISSFNEGCLSIPDVREDVRRKETIKISYLDENFKEHVETYSGLLARVIQHEYDHIEGVLFTDKLSSLKKRMIKGRLANISKGKISVEYRMKFPSLKKGR